MESSSTARTTPRLALVILGVLVVCAIALRVVAALAWWPVGTTMADAWPYAAHAVRGLFNDPQHPAGYSAFLRVGGLITREVGVYTVVQHLLAIASGVVMFAAIRRLCGSPWPALVGASAILVNPDLVFLEHQIASEALFVPLLTVSLYAVARAFDTPERWWPWPLIAGALLVMTGFTRTAAFFLYPVVVIAFVLVRPRPWLPRWRPVAVLLGTMVVGMLAYAGANYLSHDRFEVTPAAGLHLYGRVAPFAACDRFMPPPGTEALCESVPPAERNGTGWYMYDPDSPAIKLFGYIGAGSEADAKLGEFGREVAISQTRDYLATVWDHMKAFYVPSSFVWRPGAGGDIDSQLDWARRPTTNVQAVTERGLQEFFAPFSVEEDLSALQLLHDTQRVARFGATALTIATILIVLGLLVGPRRNRIAVFVLGVGGLAMLLLPMFSAIYLGRYSVPLAAPIMGGAAVAAMSLVALARRRLAIAHRGRVVTTR